MIYNQALISNHTLVIPILFLIKKRYLRTSLCPHSEQLPQHLTTSLQPQTNLPAITMHLKAIILGIAATMASLASAAPPAPQGCKPVNGGSFGPAHFHCRQVNCEAGEYFHLYTKGCSYERQCCDGYCCNYK
jgi:hypothetical protein